MKFSIKGFFSECDQIRFKLRIWSHLLEKSLWENLLFLCTGSSSYQSTIPRNATAHGKLHFVKCWYQILKDYTAKLFYLCVLQTGFSEKIENVQEKCQCWGPTSVMLRYDSIKTWLHRGYFSRNIPTFFGTFICLVSQIIIVLIELR